MIEELTPEQVAKFPEYVNKYIKLGLATTPLTEALKTEIVDIMGRIYKAGGLRPPKQVLFFDSPRAALRAAAAAVNGVDVAKVTKKMLDAETSNFCYGSQGSGWLSFYGYFINETNVQGLDPIKPSIELLGKCSLFLPYDEVCFVSQNLATVHMINGRLHSTEGPAWTYADGFCGYSLDGVEITKEILDAVQAKDSKAVKTVLKLKNTEQRLVAIKYMGGASLLEALGSKELSSMGEVQVDGRPEYVLHEFECEGVVCKMLEMRNPSEDKRHYEFVVDEIQTCAQALAWRLGWDFGSRFVAPVTKA